MTIPPLSSPALTVAPQLLGLTLRRTLEDTGQVLEGQIVEVEAYLGTIDAASHSYKGHRSARNESMYGRAGLAYVYFTYGMHHCINVVCAHENEGEAVLIRALKPVLGVEQMKIARRSALLRATRAPRDLDDHLLCAGPGRLCQAMRINRVHDGVDLLDPRAPIQLIAPDGAGGFGRSGGVGKVQRIMVGPRIGIDSAGEWRSRPMRFWVADCPSVSKSRAAGRPWRAENALPAWARSIPAPVVPAV